MTDPGSRSAIGRAGVLNLDGDMRQVGEPGQSLPVMRRLMGIRRRDRHNGAKMPRPEPPEMQVGDMGAPPGLCDAGCSVMTVMVGSSRVVA